MDAAAGFSRRARLYAADSVEINKRVTSTHLLQTGRVELRLVDDLYGHLEAKQRL